MRAAVGHDRRVRSTVFVFIPTDVSVAISLNVLATIRTYRLRPKKRRCPLHSSKGVLWFAGFPLRRFWVCAHVAILLHIEQGASFLDRRPLRTAVARRAGPPGAARLLWRENFPGLHHVADWGALSTRPRSARPDPAERGPTGARAGLAASSRISPVTPSSASRRCRGTSSTTCAVTWCSTMTRWSRSTSCARRPAWRRCRL